MSGILRYFHLVKEPSSSKAAGLPDPNGPLSKVIRYRSDTTSHSLEIFFSTRARITLDLCRVFKPATKK